MPVKNNSAIIKNSDFKEMLDEFESLVENKVFVKMPYNMWRAFKRMRTNVELKWNAEGVIIHCDSETELHHLIFGDGSFADYLLESYINHYNSHDNYNYMEHDETYATMMTTALELAPRIKESGRIAFNNVCNAVNSMSVEVIPNTLGEVSLCVDTKVNKTEFEARMNELMKKVEELTNKKEENKNMKGFNFDFGPVSGNAVRMSMYGMAVKNKAGTFVSYDAKSGDIMDVDVLNFDGANKFLYKMPVAMKDIAIGDVVIHHGAPMFVIGKSDDNKGLVVIDVIAGERKEIMLAKSPFGFNFATKVVNFLGNAFNGTANADNPFGNMWMLMALSEGNTDMKEMLPFMLMANGGMDMSNPMVMYALMGDGKMDPMMLAFMTGAFNAPAVPAPAHECKCGGNCGNCGEHNH